MMKVLIIGPSIERTKGGMATVINDQLAYSNDQLHFTHLVSHVEGSASEKLSYTISSFVRFLRKHNYDLIHIHVASDASFYRKSLFVLASRFLGKPVVMHVHGADFHTFFEKSGSVKKMYIRKIFNLCDAVLVLSQFWKDFFQGSITQKNVYVLHNGVHARLFQNCFTAPANNYCFLFLGRLGQRKGVYDLIEVIDLLVNTDKNVHLQFYLAGDGEIDQVKELIAQKNLHQNIHLLGWINEEQKLKWFKKVDTIVLPSYNEGLPMAILEAMAAGKVILSTRVGGIPDLVLDNENGFLIVPGDTEALYKHIVFLQQNPEEVVRMARSNMVKINEGYNLEKIFKQLASIYIHCIQKRKKHS